MKELKVIIIFLVIVIGTAGVALGVLSLLTFRSQTSTAESESYPDAISTSIIEGERYSIYSWNIGGASKDDTMDDKDFGGIRREPRNKQQIEYNMKGIKSALENPLFTSDIYLFQDVDKNSKRSLYMNQFKELQSSIKMPCYYIFSKNAVYIPYPWPFQGRVQNGIGTFSNFRNLSPSRISLKDSNSKVKKLFGATPEILINRYVASLTTELVIVNFVINDKAPKKSDVTKKQIEEIIEFAESEYKKGNYVIVGGSWNAIFPDLEEKDFASAIKKYPYNIPVLDKKILSDGWQFKYDKTYPTMRTMNSALRKIGGESYASKVSNYGMKIGDVDFFYFDAFLVSPNIYVRSISTINEEYRFSNHNPIRMEFNLIPADL